MLSLCGLSSLRFSTSETLKISLENWKAQETLTELILILNSLPGRHSKEASAQSGKESLFAILPIKFPVIKQKVLRSRFAEP